MFTKKNQTVSIVRLVVFFAVLLIGVMVIAPTSQATTDTHKLQIIYLVPSDAPYKNRDRLMWDATHTIQKQWHTW